MRNAKCEMRNAVIFWRESIIFLPIWIVFLLKIRHFFVKTAIKLQKNHKKIQFLLIYGVDKSQTVAYNIRGTLSKTACFTHISDSFTIES